MSGARGNRLLIPGLAGAGVLIALAAMWLSERAQNESMAGSQLQAGARALAMREVYLMRCAECHGERGEGGDGVIDFTSAPAVASLSRKRMIKALDKRHNGHIEQDLSKSAAEGVVDFIREYLMLPAPFADASTGRRIYSETCSVCHGERGDGASWAENSLFPPPRDFADADPGLLTREDMIAATTFGRAGTAMMPFATQLSTDEIAATVDYVRLAFMTRPEKTAAADSSDAAASNIASPTEEKTLAAIPDGDPAVGEALYRVNCVQCHGENGDGQGRRAYFMAIKPANFTSDAFRMRMDHARLFKAISKGVVGSPMPAWEKVLPPDKIADLAAYVQTAFIAPKESAQSASESLEWQADEAKKKD